MPIDDELSQAEQLARSDEAQAPSGILQTFRKATIELIGGNPLAAIIALGDCLKGRSDAFSAENSAYLLSIVLPKVHELVLEYERLDAKQKKFLDTDWIELLVDADRKARETRSKDRIARIGSILYNSARVGPATPADDVEELMRIAMALGDREILLLEEIARLQGPSVTGDGSLTVLSQASWGAARLSKLGMTVPDVFSIGPKLESYGLVRETAESRRGVDVPKPWPYALLPKGLKFLEFARAQKS